MLKKDPFLSDCWDAIMLAKRRHIALAKAVKLVCARRKALTGLVWLALFATPAYAQQTLLISSVPTPVSSCVIQRNSGNTDWVCQSIAAASQPFSDSSGTALIANASDPTKLLRFDVSGIATATKRVWTAPNSDLAFPGTTGGGGASTGVAGLGTNTFTGLQTLNGGVAATTGTFSSTVAVTGLLTVSGFGTHTFSAGGTGFNVLNIRNSTAGTGNGAYVAVGNDAAAERGYLLFTSSTYTPALGLVADGLVVKSEGVGGVGIIASSGAIRFYSGGTTLRGQFTSSGSFQLVDGTYVYNSFGGTLLSAQNTTGFYMGTWPTTASAANVQVANGDYIRLVTSLRAVKDDIQPISTTEARRVVMGLSGVTYISKIDADKRRWAGLIADDTEKVTPILAIYGNDGALQSVTYDRVPAYLIPVAQDHESRITAIEAKLGMTTPALAVADVTQQRASFSASAKSSFTATQQDRAAKEQARRDAELQSPEHAKQAAEDVKRRKLAAIQQCRADNEVIVAAKGTPVDCTPDADTKALAKAEEDSAKAAEKAQQDAALAECKRIKKLVEKQGGTYTCKG